MSVIKYYYNQCTGSIKSKLPFCCRKRNYGYNKSKISIQFYSQGNMDLIHRSLTTSVTEKEVRIAMNNVFAEPVCYDGACMKGTNPLISQAIIYNT